MFENQPTLVGSRVTVRPLTSDDWSGLFMAASNPEIWLDHPVQERYTEPEFRIFFEGALASGSAFSFVDQQSDTLIGSSRFHGYTESNAEGRSEIEIGWTFLAKEYWGSGYNGEIKQLMLTHAFQFVDIVVFLVGEHNIRSQKAVEKIGGVKTKKTVDRQLSGQSYIHWVYEIRKEKFLTASV